MDPQELVDAFASLESWEERYAYIIDLGRQLPAFPEALRCDAHLVPGCLSRVWLVAEPRAAADGVRLHLRADSDAAITKGLVAIALQLFQDRRVADIADVDLGAFFDQLRLGDHLSSNRRNGFTSMIQTVRRLAAQHAALSPDGNVVLADHPAQR